jgi:hypothetical protein
MGIDVAVHCRCWEDGRTSEPPVPPDLILPVDLTDPDRQRPELHEDVTSRRTIAAFYRWRSEQACDHRNMIVLAERIWRWHGTEAYTSAFSTMDHDRCPVLAAIAYGSGGVPLSAEDAGAAINELDWLTDHARTADLGEITEVVDVVSGERWWVEPLMYQAPPWAIGLDRRGLFIWDAKASDPARERVELMRAVRLSVQFGAQIDDRSPEHHRRFQHAVRGSRAGVCDCVEVTFTDLDSGGRRVLPMAGWGYPFHRETRYRSPLQLPDGAEEFDFYDRDAHHLRVLTRPILLADFTDVLSALRRIFQAAVDAGTAVVWQ